MSKPIVNIKPVASRYARPDERVIEFSDGKSGGLIAIERMEDGSLSVALYRLDDDIQIAIGYESGKQTLVGAHMRQISEWELADLPEEWENPSVDTRHYIQTVMRAWEVDEATYLKHKENGNLCQKHDGRYYVA